MEQISEFREECMALYGVLRPCRDEDFQRITQFKQWTINDIIRHLSVWNHAAGLTLQDREAFDKFFEPVHEFNRMHNLRGFERRFFAGIDGRDLLQKWRDGYEELAERFKRVDPRLRLRWGGPELSARSCLTSRQMEVWAHGQAVYDEFGIARTATDGLKNIAVLGINTFEWTFNNRGLPVPPARPTVSLLAPSGACWRWEGVTDSHIEGSALEFCQVVTQVRNVRDTNLQVVGTAARRWMDIAQCFAGPPEDPPLSGTRYTKIAPAPGAEERT
jgi:uncharacterized protein (TIGR03084 family)